MELFEQGLFQIDPNETPETLARKREAIRDLLKGQGSARYIGQGVGQALTSIVGGIKNRKMDKFEGQKSQDAQNMFADLFGGSYGSGNGGGNTSGARVSSSSYSPKPENPWNMGTTAPVPERNKSGGDTAVWGMNPGQAAAGGEWDMGTATNDIGALIAETASALDIDPVDLATVISYETGGTFDPMQPGPTTQWGQHRGLIQFGEPQAQENGVDFSSREAALASQLGADGAIVKYLRRAGFKPGMGLMDLYSTINAGGPGRYGASDANNGGAPGTVADKVNNQMAGHRRKALELVGGGETMMAKNAPVSGGGGQATLAGQAGGDQFQGNLPVWSDPRVFQQPVQQQVDPAQQPRQTQQPSQQARNFGYSGPSEEILLEALSNPWLPAPQREQATYLLQQARQAKDPVYQMQLERAQLELDAARRGAGNKPSSVVELEWRAQQAGLKPGTPEYQSFIMNGGGDPATFRALDMQAKAAGFEPGTPGYENFMATRGAGLQAGARVTAENLADIETGGKAAAAIAAGENAQKAGMAAWDALGTVQQSIPKLQRVIELVDAGADTGTIANQFPALNDATKELRMIQNELGLDVVGAVTFGALSEGELRLALSTALPTNLSGPGLKDWVTRKIAAQEKLAAYYNEQARFLMTPGNTLTGWMDHKSAQERSPADGGQNAPKSSGDEITFDQFKADPTAQAAAEKYGVTIEEMWEIRKETN